MFRLVMRGTAFPVASPRTALPCELDLRLHPARTAGAVLVIRCAGELALPDLLPEGRAQGHIELRASPRPNARLELAIASERGPHRLWADWSPTPLHPILSLTRLAGHLVDRHGVTTALLQLHFDTRRDLATLLASPLRRAAGPPESP